MINSKFLLRVWWTVSIMFAAGCASSAFAAHYWFIGGAEVGLGISGIVGLIAVGRP